MSDSVVANADSRMVGLVRNVAIGGLAGLLSGFVFAGVGARVVMRITSLVAPAEAIGRRTEGGNVIGTVTLDGSLGFLFFFGLTAGVLGALLVVMLWPWVSTWGRWKPVAMGAFVLGLGSTEAVDPHNRDFAVLGNQLFAVLLFWSLFFAWAFAAVWLRGVLDRRFPSGSRRSTIAYGVITTLGLSSVWLLVETLFSEFSDIPLVVAIAVLVLGVATVGVWVMRVRRVEGSLRRAVRIGGYSAFAVSVVFGLTTAVRDALEIIT